MIALLRHVARLIIKLLLALLLLFGVSAAGLWWANHSAKQQAVAACRQLGVGSPFTGQPADGWQPMLGGHSRMWGAGYEEAYQCEVTVDERGAVVRVQVTGPYEGQTVPLD